MVVACTVAPKPISGLSALRSMPMAGTRPHAAKAITVPTLYWTSTPRMNAHAPAPFSANASATTT
jgi:hypothetical protein